MVRNHQVTGSLTVAALKERYRTGSQAKAPAPPNRKFLCVNVGQTLSSANPFARFLRQSVPEAVETKNEKRETRNEVFIWH
jgi:hypothetical protein